MICSDRLEDASSVIRNLSDSVGIAIKGTCILSSCESVVTLIVMQRFVFVPHVLVLSELMTTSVAKVAGIDMAICASHAKAQRNTIWTSFGTATGASTKHSAHLVVCRLKISLKCRSAMLAIGWHRGVQSMPPRMSSRVEHVMFITCRCCRLASIVPNHPTRLNMNGDRAHEKNVVARYACAPVALSTYLSTRESVAYAFQHLAENVFVVTITLHEAIENIFDVAQAAFVRFILHSTMQWSVQRVMLTWFGLRSSRHGLAGRQLCNSYCYQRQ